MSVIPTDAFENFLYNLRVSHQLSQKSMASQLAVGPSYYNDLEKNRRKPTPRVCDAIASMDHVASIKRQAHEFGAAAHGWTINQSYG